MRQQRHANSLAPSHPIKCNHITLSGSCISPRKCSTAKSWKCTNRSGTDFGIVDRARTRLSPCWPKSNIRNFHRAHAVARKILIDTIASYIDAKVSRGQIVMDTQCYAEISHALGKRQAHGTIDIDDEYFSDDEYSPPPSPAAAPAVAPQQRIANYLSHAMLAKEFLDNANTHDTSHLCGSLARLHRPDLLQTLLAQMDAPFVSCLFQHDEYCRPPRLSGFCGDLSLPVPALLLAAVGLTARVLARRPG
jgi:hypothetical protein